MGAFLGGSGWVIIAQGQGWRAKAGQAAKATPGEAEGTSERFALGLGVLAAEAHPDAEFFGIGGQTVSRGERRALNDLRVALGLRDEA